MCRLPCPDSLAPGMRTDILETNPLMKARIISFGKLGANTIPARPANLQPPARHHFQLRVRFIYSVQNTAMCRLTLQHCVGLWGIIEIYKCKYDHLDKWQPYLHHLLAFSPARVPPNPYIYSAGKRSTSQKPRATHIPSAKPSVYAWWPQHPKWLLAKTAHKQKRNGKTKL